MSKTKDLSILDSLKVSFRDSEDKYETLLAYYQSFNNLSDLRQALQDTVEQASSLPDEERSDLRDKVSVLLASFSNRIKTDDLDGKLVEITKARWIETKYEGTFFLTGTFQEGPNSGKEFQCWMPGSNQGPVFRFFRRRVGVQGGYPVKVSFRKEPHTTKDGKTGSIWRLEQYPDHTIDNWSEIPW